MTKTQIRKILNNLYDKGVLGELNDKMVCAEEEIDNLIYELEETKDNIEPYENKNDLTEQQEERVEWLEELISDLEELKSDIEDWEYNLNDKEDCFRDRE